jgi:hypothetical protein
MQNRKKKKAKRKKYPAHQVGVYQNILITKKYFVPIENKIIK